MLEGAGRKAGDRRLDARHLLVLVLDRGGILRSLNEGAAASLGPEAVGAPFVERFVPEHARAVAAARLADVLATGGSAPASFPVVGADCVERSVSWEVQVLSGSEGMLHLLGSPDDAPPRPVLTHPQLLVETLAERVSAIIWEGNPRDWTFTYVSEQAERLLGFPARKWIEEPDFWVRHIHPDDRERVVSYCSSMTGKGLAHDFEYRMIARDGRVVWFRDIVSVIVHGGEPTRFTGVMIDITPQKMAEAEAACREARLLDANRVLLDLARFTGGMSLEHVLRHVVVGAARALGVTQVGVWRFSRDRTRLENLLLYNAPTERFSRPGDLLTTACPRYVAALETGLLIDADDAQEDPRTCEFREAYLVPFHVASMMDVPIRQGGEVVGILCNEQIGEKRRWTDDEKRLAAALADRLSVALEAHERERAERALRETRNRLHTVMEHAPVGLLAMDAVGILTLAEGRVLTGLALGTPEIVGKPFSTAFADFPDIVAAARRALVGESLTRLVHVGGRALETRWLPTRGQQGTVDGVIAVVQDVTERVQAEAELFRSREHLEAAVAERTRQLAEANRDLEAFSSSVAHDLRAPLRAIDGFTQLAVEALPPEQAGPAGAYLQRVRNAAARMAELIDDLLWLSRVGLVEMHREPVDLTALSRAILANLANAEPDRKVDVSVAEGLQADADPSLLRVTMENLLGNAWKFTSRTKDARIEVGRVALDPPTFYVRDNGAGFDPSSAGRLFRPFSRLHLPSDFPGTGIGLATVARIVTRHGGNIRADGSPGKGATFTFTLGPPGEAPTGRR